MVRLMNAIEGPVITLIVPVWGDDALVGDLIKRLEIDNTTCRMDCRCSATFAKLEGLGASW